MEEKKNCIKLERVVDERKREENNRMQKEWRGIVLNSNSSNIIVILLSRFIK